MVTITEHYIIWKDVSMIHLISHIFQQKSNYSHIVVLRSVTLTLLVQLYFKCVFFGLFYYFFFFNSKSKPKSWVVQSIQRLLCFSFKFELNLTDNYFDIKYWSEVQATNDLTVLIKWTDGLQGVGIAIFYRFIFYNKLAYQLITVIITPVQIIWVT